LRGKYSFLDRQAVSEQWRVRTKAEMKTKDKSRKWMWWLLGSIAALQTYFVWELLAAFALFALGFLIIAAGVGSLYMLHRMWAVTVDRIADSQHPIMVAVRQGVYSVEDMARRPFRRPGSAQPAN
jgi:uncharacterized membrane protein YhaH (DUF805 family)